MAPAVATYAPRDPSHTVLYTVIAEHLETFLASCHDDPDGSGLPAYVEREFYDYLGTGSVEWEWLLILKQSLIQMPGQFSRDPYVMEIPGRMGIYMPYVVYPINVSRVFVRELFYIQIA